jgi:hypothetical protein
VNLAIPSESLARLDTSPLPGLVRIRMKNEAENKIFDEWLMEYNGSITPSHGGISAQGFGIICWGK